MMLRSRHAVRMLTMLLAVSASGLAGCAGIKALAYYTAPQTEKIPPEYNKLAGRKVLVYVWAPPEVLWDYPKVRLDLATYVGAYLTKNVKDITLVDTVRVEDYIERNHTFEIDPVQIGREFKADVVLHLSVFQHSMRDPGMAHFYRGRVGASVVVWDVSRPGEPADRIPLRDVLVAVPPDSATGYANIQPTQIRQATYDAFAVEVGRKFHEWDRPLE